MKRTRHSQAATISTQSAVVCFALLIVGSESGIAQERQQYELEEVVVTARKREESLQDAPVAISAYSGDDLKRRQLTSVAQIESFTPSLIFDTSEGIGGGSSAQVFIRGVGQSDFNIGTEPGVGIYIDGVYLGRTPGATFDLLDVERVEVLRGPQGTLFGRNTIGGAISLISKAPAKELGGRVQVVYGSGDRVDVKASVDLPISQAFRVKITTLVKKQNGYVNVINTGQKLGDVDVLASRFGLQWDAADALTFDVAIDLSRQRQAGAPTVGLFFDDSFLPAGNVGPPTDSGVPFALATIAAFYNTVGQNGIPNALPAPAAGTDIFNQPLVNADGNCPFSTGAAPNSSLTNPNCFNAQYRTGNLFSTYGSRTRNDNDVSGIGLTATWDITDKVTLKSITSFRQMKGVWTNDIDNSPLLVGETANNMKQDQFSQELQVSGSTDFIQWLGGLYYFTEDATDTGQITTGSGNFINGAVVENKALALFGQVTIDLTKRFFITLGGRFTDEDKSFTPISRYVTAFFIPAPFFNLPENLELGDEFGCQVNPDGSGGCPAGLEFLRQNALQQDISEFQPTINVGHRFHDNLLAYVTYSEGFKSGGGNQRAIFPSLNPSFLLYKPEFVNVVELGFKSSAFNNRMRLNGAIFFSEYKDIQTNVQVGFVPTVQNAGDAKINGFELELFALPTANLEFSASLSVIDAKYTRVADNANINLGSKFANTPKQSASLGLAYDFNVLDNHTLTPRIDWSYRSKIYNDADNSEELAQSGLSLFNMSIVWKSSDAWLASFGITNLTNKEYIVAGFRNTVGGFGQGIVARKREWSLQFERRF